MTLPSAGIFGSARVAVGGGGGGLTFQQAAVNPADGATQTFTAQPIGTAAANRRVIVAVTARNGTSITSATIGGVSATVDVTNGTTTLAALISAVVPTGTTADVVINFSASSTQTGIGVWTANGVSPTGNTAADSTNVFNFTVTTTTGDIVIAAVCWVLAASSATWTGGTEEYDQNIEGSVFHSGLDTVATGTSTALSATTGANGSGAAAAYA